MIQHEIYLVAVADRLNSKIYKYKMGYLKSIEELFLFCYCERKIIFALIGVFRYSILSMIVNFLHNCSKVENLCWSSKIGLTYKKKTAAVT